MKLLSLLALIAALSGCATTEPTRVYYAEGAEVRVYSNSTALLNAVPLEISATYTALGPLGYRLLGWYDEQRKIIYALDDPKIIAHEMRHHKEGHFHYVLSNEEKPK